MPINVGSILQNAAVALTDARDYRRWPLPELYLYLWDGVLELQEKRPDLFARNEPHALAAGTRQQVSGVHSVLRVMMNLVNGSPARAIRTVTRLHLDNTDQDWHGATATELVQNVALDEHERGVFWVSPPNTGTGAVDVQVSVRPAQIAVMAGADPLLLASYDFTLEVEREFGPALTYYVLHRAWAKDADFAANQQNSNQYYDWFLRAIGGGE